jgi:hypothetical protein
MLKSRDSHGTGYVLAIIGVASALVVVIVGASTIAALNRGVPKELWAIGGALSGALVGILAPPPRTRTSGKEEAPLSAAAETVAAANEAARDRAQEEDNGGKAVIQGAERGLQAITQRAKESKASLEAAPADDPCSARSVAQLNPSWRASSGPSHASERCLKTRLPITCSVLSGESTKRQFKAPGKSPLSNLPGRRASRSPGPRPLPLSRPPSKAQPSRLEATRSGAGDG